MVIGQKQNCESIITECVVSNAGDVFSSFYSQRTLSNSEDECTHLRNVYEKSQDELKDLMEKHRQVLCLGSTLLMITNDQ